MEIFPMILVRAGGLPFPIAQTRIFPLSSDFDPETVISEAAARVQDSFEACMASLPDSDLRTTVYNARKAFFQKHKMPPEKLLETLASLDQEPLAKALLEHLRVWRHATQWPQQLEKVYQDSLTFEWESLQQTALDPAFRQALLFASHDLLDQLPAFCAKSVADFDKKDRQTAISVFQYRCRGMFKTSPLGRFTTVQLWRFAQEQVESFDAEKIAVTPSVAMLPALYEVLLREPAFYKSLQLVLNPCIPTTNPENENLSWLYFDGEQEAFQQLQPNPVVALTVQLLLDNNRKLAYPLLLDKLGDAVDADREQLERLVQELISLGLLAWQLPEMGLSPSWSSNLTQYISFLPSAPVLTDTAFLLQSLRVSARAMPYQALEVARQTQRDCREQMAAFFEQYNGMAPPVPTEQVFFEDVQRSLPIHCPEPAIQQFAADLSACWKSRTHHKLPPFRARLQHFTDNILEMGQVVDFQAFCKMFFEDKTPDSPVSAPRFDGKLGAMLQVFNTIQGYRAVVNAMFPGGGKLFARWMHLFPSDFREGIKDWIAPGATLYPWQGWSNANFQSIEANKSLQVPDGRVGQKQSKGSLLLTDLGVRRGPNGPELMDKKNGQQVVLTDLGLEAPESRPPVLQVLWHLGVPYVSSLALLAPSGSWTAHSDNVMHQARIEYGSLVLARAAWSFQPGFFEPVIALKRKSAARFWVIRSSLLAVGIPRYFFARGLERREKPQYFDLESPVSLLIFEKMLENTPTGRVFIEEMLPTPDQWVLGASEKYAGEFVLEFAV